MSITFFGVIWMVLIFICFFLEIKYLFLLTLISMTLQCDVIFLINTELGIGPAIVTSLAFIFKSIIYNARVIIIKDKIKNFFILFMICVTITTCYMDKSMEKITSFFQIYVYIICFFRMISIRDSISIKFSSNCVKVIILFISIVGVLQMLHSSSLVDLSFILRPLIYNESWDYSIVFNKSYLLFRFYSTFMEPSYCSVFLVGVFFYLLSIEGKDNRNIGLMIMLGVEIALTTSATAFGAMFITGVLFICSNTNKKFMKYIVPIVMVIFILVVCFGWNDIVNQILIKLASGSGRTRRNWNKAGLNAFFESPLIGMGYKNVRASSFFVTLLGEFGILGTGLFALSLICVIKEIFIKDDKFAVASSWFVVGSVIAMIIACPDLSLAPFWMAMYIYAISHGRMSINEERIECI